VIRFDINNPLIKIRRSCYSILLSAIVLSVNLLSSLHFFCDYVALPLGLMSKSNCVAIADSRVDG
jgi:hypothetical protein